MERIVRDRAAPDQVPERGDGFGGIAAAGGFVDVPSPDGGEPLRMVASPVDFAGTPWRPRAAPPEHAQHTEEVLLELGHDWDRILELKELGAIP